MEFNINVDKLCAELENSIKCGNEVKSREICLQLLDYKVYLQIELEEKPKPNPPLNVEKIVPESRLNNKRRNKILF